MKKICDNILEAIGNTPLVRVNRLTKGVTPATVLAKVETFNPGNSIKDRMAIKMVEDAERAGLLEPGRDHHRRHVRQHRHGTRHRGRHQGLQVHLHHDGQAVEGEGGRLARVRGRGHRLPDQRRSRGPALLLLRLFPPAARDPELVEGQPVRQPVATSRPTTSRPARRSGIRPTARSRISSSASGTGGTISGVGRYLKERNPGSRCGASTPTARSSRDTRRPACSTRTRSTLTSPRASARTSCLRTWTSTSSITSRR